MNALTKAGAVGSWRRRTRLPLGSHRPTLPARPSRPRIALRSRRTSNPRVTVCPDRADLALGSRLTFGPDLARRALGPSGPSGP